MATLVKTAAGTWKALVRKTGWPTNTKTFRTKREPEDWARRTKTKWSEASTSNVAAPSA